MWIYLSDSFLSIVTSGRKTHLTVRARKAGDIERVFPTAKVVETPGRDYAYRAEIARAAVAKVLADRVTAIDYPNFKDSVSDDQRHDAYADCWSAMSSWQKRTP